MNDFDAEKANGEHFHMEVDTKGEQFEAGIEEESSEEHYSRLVNSLWHKGIQLVTREDNFASQAAASREKLQASYTQLAAIRDELNTVKSKVRAIINTGDNTIERWRSYTSFTHPLRYLPRHLVAKCAERGAPEPQMCTQAYCKFVQMAAAHPSLLEQPGLLDNCQVPFRSIHLCEAPGAFVHAARDCLAKKGIQLDWRMNSLNPAYEQPQIGPSTSSAFSMDDQLMLGNQDRILFGPDNSGDISHWDQSYLEKVISTENGGKFHLVTGDGGFDCTDEPENQESRIRPLIKQQFRVACGCLCSDGNLLLKVYIFFEPETIQLLADICGHFAEVHCLKPPNSKPGNSEVYLLCMGFADNSNSLGLPLSEPFLDRVEHCARFFADHQMRFIQFNLRTFRRLSQSERCKMEFQKCTIQEVMAEFLRNQIAPEPKIINFNLLINGQDDEVQTAD